MTTRTLNWWVLEDNNEDFELLDSACRRSDGRIEIERFRSGDDLLARSKDSVPDLLYLDLRLPVTGGMEVLGQLKQNPAYECIPKLVFSTSANPNEIRQAYQLGGTSFHVKRVETKEMIKLLDHTITYWTADVALPEYSARNACRSPLTGEPSDARPTIPKRVPDEHEA
ncbi:response regulator [Roseiconus lacunae]|uniref:Response regulator n=1 Tax=Roseiconus lacunae TaxID=2605694 RepID=A0ABT7PG03_9BACT|nr:response regulator [Roseiconus lacunae]MCD0460540.1 response regulator [Roseiconus lacunae]MDM4015412.1 response regulator [Roseiconus lacunae]WRQ52910.1 response regulator [Stieleria sp. HD01]